MEEALLSRHYTESMLLGGYTVDARAEAQTWKGCPQGLCLIVLRVKDYKLI